MTIRLTEPMQAALKALPIEWTNASPNFVSNFPSVEALRNRGLAQIRLKPGDQTTLQVRVTELGVEYRQHPERILKRAMF